MPVTNTLCNPTPWRVQWEYQRGICLTIDGDGTTDVTDPTMYEQMRPDVPGTAAVRDELGQLGLFLRDVAVPYEVQALDALEALLKEKKQVLSDGKARLELAYSQGGGNISEEAVARGMDELGYNKIKEQISVLEKRVSLYRKRVNPEKAKRTQHRQFDPERTLLFLNPPKEFESKVAMEIFLEENPEMKKRQDMWLAEIAKRSAPKQAPQEATE